MAGNLDHVRSYYESLNTPNADAIAAHFTSDATHYYTRLGPHRGRGIAENACWAIRNLDARWHLEHGIEADGEVVIEWSMSWRNPDSGERRINRGTEWFRFEDGLISEVRAYHHGDRRNPEGNLLGFDHAARGHTTLED
jgi:hypothetical protein